MLGEVIISDRHMSDGQMDLFLQLFFKTEKCSLNWRLDSTVTGYALLIFIVISLWQTTSLLKYMFIRHKIRTKNHAAWLSIVFPFHIKFLFLTEDTKE